MLNPDGSEKWTRRNALDIDMNRDFLLESSKEFPILKKIAKENHVEKIVVGVPINMDGTKGFQAENCIEFSKHFENDFEIINASYFGGYELWDESNIKNRYFLKLKYYIQTLFFKMQKLLYQKTKENKSFSCYLGIIARRNPSQKN